MSILAQNHTDEVALLDCIVWGYYRVQKVFLQEGDSLNNQFIQGVMFDWNRIDNDSYLKSIEAFKGIEKLDFNKSITFFVGENGSGKSTLLEALAVAHGFNPEGGTKNYVFSTHDTHSELCDAIRIAKGVYVISKELEKRKVQYSAVIRQQH